MGICWSSLPDQKPNSLPIVPSTIDNLSEGDTCSVGDNSWLSVGSSNLTTWVSQVSGSFTRVWGKNNGTHEGSRYLDAGSDGDFENCVISNIAGANLKVFSFAQLISATNNFGRDMVVGRGGFGKVYKGWQKEMVPSMGIKKSAIAVKKLGTASRQGFKQWQAEVNILGRLSHPNLVKLLGYCYENKQFLLVYEYLSNGSLNYHLFGKGSVQPLPWDIRFKIAKGVAQGLTYMHSPDQVSVIHRDLKSSNILLDKFYNAKISDFGLAALVPSADDSQVETHLMGTYGYAAPEVYVTGHHYAKSDVYSFGVVLVEMLTGLRAIDRRRPDEQQFLVSWIIPFLSNKRKLKSIMDVRLKGKYPLKEASLVAQLAIRCLQAEPRIRPSMKEIAETLEQVEARKYKSIRS
ncbi:KINASE CX32 putative-RELATED [Salix viminalis]|uniref:KINASE CX32 putative-RELATED n=1 Tax=Salix viminalis TaxID=40686 RepID=A0A9Q0NNS4_SALVM|nr:KINASE CX32 putative-RELATED [Salix viminalis]KAJ6673168.1 KINASE CX32 putative-RELATED [Salix viminalis]